MTDVELKLSVPPGIEVLQAPSKIPPVFNGEKLVLYGWLKGGAGKSGPGCAVLRGKMLGSPVEHRVDFQLGVSSLSPTDIPIVHQLASKSLIQDWQDGNGLSGKSDKEKKSAIIKLSVESSVVSSHTAYIAVDEDQDKPIEGAIKTWDLTATEALMVMGAQPRNMMISPAGMHCRSGKKCRERRSHRDRSRDRDGRERSRSKWDLMRGCRNGEMIFDYVIMSLSVASPKVMKKKEAYCGNAMYDMLDVSGYEIMEISDVLSESSSSGSSLSSGSPPPQSVNNDFFSFSSVSTGSSLFKLVTLQAAEGYWSLDTGLASIIGRSLSDLKSASPSGCSDVVWGTLLAIVLLESRFSSQHDEWELVTMKAEMWLQGQVLPPGSSISSLKETAKQSLP